MSRPDWTRVQELFSRALDLSPSQRDEFLREASGGDAGLLAEVRAMLAQHEAAPLDFLSPPDADIGAGEEAVEPSLVGMRFGAGDFEIIRELGRGSMGVVFEARQISLDRRVALKVLREGLLTRRSDVERFHREAKSAAKLQHPNIVRVLADGVEERTHWFAMELVDGHDLDQDLRNLRNGAASILPTESDGSEIRAAARVAAEVAEALEEAHANGLVHRDVKPSNILLTREGRALLADFGIARDESLGKLTQTGMELGSLYYMSPEQARVLEHVVDHRSDVYSLGVVLYELLAKRRPYGGKTQPEILSAIRRGEAKSLRAFNREISRDLAAICSKAMHRDVARRYQTAMGFAQDLRRFLRGEAVQAKATSVVERIASTIRRNRVLVAFAAVLAVSGSVVFLMTQRLDRETSTELTVRLRDASGNRVVGAALRILRFDVPTGIPNATQDLGPLPIERRLVPSGFVRLSVTLEDGGLREFTRTLRVGEAMRFVFDVRKTPRVHDDMLLVRGGLLEHLPWGTGREPEKALDVPRTIDDFYIDRYEVSNADWRAFLRTRSDAYRIAARPEYWSEIEAGSERDALPVTGISWLHARDYAEWAGKRLATLSEWFWAARNRSAWDRTPWATRASWPQFFSPRARTPKSVSAYFAYMVSVRSHEEFATRDPAGLHWMLGNAQEWIETPAWTLLDGERLPELLRRHALGLAARGSKGWFDLRFVLHAGIGPAHRNLYRGFRCAKSVVRR